MKRNLEEGERVAGFPEGRHEMHFEREANDKYFQRVNEGVLDVVAKLEEVASAMKAVEQESRDIWGETESARTSYHE